MAELKQQDVIDYIKGMSVLEVSEMVKKLEDELGVQAAAAVPVAAFGAAGAGGGEAAEEKTEFDVLLKDIGPKKIQVIKAVRTFRADLGLKEAKDLVDSAPVKVLEGVPKEQAESAANALKEQDAGVEIT